MIIEKTADDHQRYLEVSLMVANQANTENRRTKRYSAAHGAFAVIVHSPGLTHLCQIIDIGRGGLSFCYSGLNRLSMGVTELSIVMREKNFRLGNIQVKNVSDEEVQKSLPTEISTKRRRSVRFISLSYDQKFELEHFLRRYTTGEAGALANY
jgi:hypothetical protein